MRNVICFSGGKDSTALILWARENLEEFEAVFCDTGWEHPLTYLYVNEINSTLLDGRLRVLRSSLYDGMRELVQLRKRIPSMKARFCTDELKVQPMIDWLKTVNDEVIVYQGIRADESQARAKMTPRQWSDYYDAWVERPLFYWSAENVFDYLKRHSVKPNPLYLLGAKRVGCFPCVLISHQELKAMMKRLPEIKERIRELESICGRTFFMPNYIPDRFRTFDPKSGKRLATSEDVFRYIERVDMNQLRLVPEHSCVSVYNLCE